MLFGPISKKNRKNNRLDGPNSDFYSALIRSKAFFGPWQYERRFLLVVASGRGIVVERLRVAPENAER